MNVVAQIADTKDGVTRRSCRIEGMTNTDQVGMQQGPSTPATTTTASSSSPWSAATPLLQNLINQYGNTPTAVTSGQTAALSNLNSAASSVPNFGDTASSGVSKLFNNDVTPQVGMLGQGYDTLQANLGATASGANLNPNSTPGFSDAMDTLTKNITTANKGVYAASGRDPSGAGSFAKTNALGIEQGEAPAIAAQFNQNQANQMSAANSLFSGANTTATGQAGLNQLPLNSILSGLQGAGMLSNLYTQPAQTQVAAANASQAQPYTNLSEALTPALGLGALGTNTTGTSTQTPANNPLMNIIGGVSAGAGLMFSDIKLKENVRKEGEMPSGLPIKSYNMKHDPMKRRQTGFIAQDVMKKHPQAVHQVGRFRAVDYPHAIQLGMIPSKKAA